MLPRFHGRGSTSLTAPSPFWAVDPTGHVNRSRLGCVRTMLRMRPTADKNGSSFCIPWPIATKRHGMGLPFPFFEASPTGHDFSWRWAHRTEIVASTIVWPEWEGTILEHRDASNARHHLGIM